MLRLIAVLQKPNISMIAPANIMANIMANIKASIMASIVATFTAAFTAAIMFLLFMSSQAWAAAGPWQGNEIFQARLITASDAVGTAQNVDAGLEVKLKKGWKIYWRSPGDAGLPPELDFSSSPAILSHAMEFPAPYRFTVLGFESYGYKDRVIFPLTLRLSKPGRGMTAAADFAGS